MIPQQIITKKRDGGRLTPEEIEFFVAGLTNGEVADGQAAAFAMAVYFRDLDDAECASLASAMARSGRGLAWREDLPGPVVDKHSTGGVGDLASLLIAPMAAACGAFVPMIAGRGLGHTGGTVDKLEAIPGYRVDPGEDVFRDVVQTVGCAIIGQTDALAPADRRLYGIRDLTGAVESIPLIVASILSKKLSAGLAGLVMDVKTGSGAFMTSEDQARILAERLAGVARGANLPTACLLTDMNEPLAPVAGAALETGYAIDLLKRVKRDLRVESLCIELVGEMTSLVGLCAAPAEGRRLAEKALDSGEAAERFARMAAALGGPVDLLDRPTAYLVEAPVIVDVPSPADGWIAAIDTRALGNAVVEMGGGRTRPGQAIDPSVGLRDLAGVGERVTRGDPVARVCAATVADAGVALRSVQAAYQIGPVAPPRRPLVLERIGGAAAGARRVC